MTVLKLVIRHSEVVLIIRMQRYGFDLRMKGQKKDSFRHTATRFFDRNRLIFRFETMKQTTLRILFLFISLILSSSAHSQHTILLLSGKQIQAESYTTGDMFVSYKKPGDTRNSLRVIDRFDVFAVKHADGTEEIIYSPDSSDFTVEEARQYIQGEQVADSMYRKPSTAWTSAALGAGSSILSFYALPVPFLYSVVLGRFNPKNLQLPDGIDTKLSTSEPFVFGYQKAARNLKIQRSLKWGYISLGVGLTAFIIYGASSR